MACGNCGVSVGTAVTPGKSFESFESFESKAPTVDSVDSVLHEVPASPSVGEGADLRHSTILRQTSTNHDRSWTDHDRSTLVTILVKYFKSSVKSSVVSCLKMSAACNRSGRLVAETPCHENETWRNMQAWKTWESGLHCGIQRSKEPDIVAMLWTKL
jgi:hypothetical protein